jgi:hypothetical protein
MLCDNRFKYLHRSSPRRRTATGLSQVGLLQFFLAGESGCIRNGGDEAEDQLWDPQPIEHVKTKQGPDCYSKDVAVVHGIKDRPTMERFAAELP